MPWSRPSHLPRLHRDVLETINGVQGVDVGAHRRHVHDPLGMVVVAHRAGRRPVRSKERWRISNGVEMHRLSNLALALDMASVVPLGFSLKIEPLLDLVRNHCGIVVGWKIRRIPASNELGVTDGNENALLNLTGAGDRAVEVSSKNPEQVAFPLLRL